MSIDVIEDSVPVENRITQDVIDNLERPTFSLIENDEITDYIYSFCKSLLTFAKDKHESKEMAYAINLSTLDYVGSAFGGPRSIDITPLVRQMENTNYVFIVMHNHPSDSPFSPKDLNTFFETTNMAILIVLGNKGTIYTIEKNSTIKDRDYLKIKKIIIEYRNNVKAFEQVISELSEFDITYSKF